MGWGPLVYTTEFHSSQYPKMVARLKRRELEGLRTYQCEADEQLLVHTAAAEQLSTAGQQAH